MPLKKMLLAGCSLAGLALAAMPAGAQHGVIREYAALAPTENAKPLPPLLDEPLLDASITLGPDKAFYLTGSAAGPHGAAFTSQISIWRSADMATWKKIRTLDLGAAKARSPEIHYLRGKFYLTLGLEGGGTALATFDAADLASAAFKQAPITERGEDPSLFLDDDGTFYWVMGPGEVARMKADPMAGLAGEPRRIGVTIAGPASKKDDEQTCEGLRGAFLAKINGKYHLFITGRIRHRGFGRTGLVEGAEDVLVSASDKPDADYKPFYVAFPCAGQSTLFRDGAGALWATFSGQDVRAILRARPAAFRVERVPATEPRWPIGFAGLETPARFPFGLMLRPDQAFIYENGVGLAKAIPMDKVPGQKAEVPWIRDTCIMLGHDGTYYMVGTTGNMDGINLWKSPDLKRFEFVNAVWKPAAGPALWYNKNPKRLLWAPELHYLKGTYWIPWCASGLGNSLLKSTSGRAEGPYVPAFKFKGPVDQHIDASMFQDDDGAVYYVWQDGLLRKMNDAMDDFVAEPQKLLTVTGEHVGYEGVFLRKMGPWYVVAAAEWCGGSNRADGSYDMMYAVSKNLMGPYSKRRVAVPHAGHGMLFKDKSGRWCAAMFGNDRTAPFRAMPGVVPLAITDTGSDLIIKPAEN